MKLGFTEPPSILIEDRAAKNIIRENVPSSEWMVMVSEGDIRRPLYDYVMIAGVKVMLAKSRD